jgi:hypothetical protein
VSAKIRKDRDEADCDGCQGLIRLEKAGCLQKLDDLAIKGVLWAVGRLWQQLRMFSGFGKCSTF